MGSVDVLAERVFVTATAILRGVDSNEITLGSGPLSIYQVEQLRDAAMMADGHKGIKGTMSLAVEVAAGLTYLAKSAKGLSGQPLAWL